MTQTPSPWSVRGGRDPKVGGDWLRRRLGRITSWYKWPTRRRRVYRRIALFAGISTIVIAIVVGLFLLSPWPAGATIRHLLSYPNCDVARAMDLAPARRGEPGYWSHHDADNDGIACEPWPPVRRN